MSAYNEHKAKFQFQPSFNKHQKGVYYSGIKIYIHLPTAMKDLSGGENKFNLALKRYCGDIHILHCSVLRSTSEQRSVSHLLSLSR
jgi:hypothetical protein